MDPTESVSHAKAYTRVKEFLKQMLHDIIDSVGHNLDASNPCHCLVAKLGPTKVVSEFRQQLLAFARQEWPFTDPIPDGDALSWWELLGQHPHARVLAVSTYLQILECWTFKARVGPATDAGNQDILNFGQFDA